MKKAQQDIILWIIIAIISLVVIMSVNQMILKKTADKSSLDACRLSLAYVNNLDAGTKGLTGAKQRCVRQHVTLPQGKDSDKKAIQKEIADLMANCWYSHLEGKLDSALGSTLWDKNCDVCYTFTIDELKSGKNDIDSFSLEEQFETLYGTVKKVNSDSDGCYLGGGKCLKTKKECDDKSNIDSYFTFKEDSNKCLDKMGSNEYGCCQSRYSCLNNGGSCTLGDCDDGSKKYDNWACPTQEPTCCVKSENYYNYMDYILTGPGSVIPQGDIKEFKKGELYAVSYVSNTKNFLANTYLSTGVVTMVVGTAAFVLSGGTLGLIGTVTAAVWGTFTYLTTKNIEKFRDKTSAISIAPYSVVQDKCNIQN